jgi:hypothetical protein
MQVRRTERSRGEEGDVVNIVRMIGLALVLAAATVSGACSDTGTEPAGSTDPLGPELMSLSQRTFALAPGREGWLYVSSFIQVSASSAKTVEPQVTYATSDAAVATVTPDSASRAHILARAPGIATITVKSRRSGTPAQTVTVTVAQAPVGNEAGLVYSASATMRPTRSLDGSNIPLGPTELAVSVVISNPTATTRDIWLRGCAAWARVSATPILSGTPAADVPSGLQCMVADRRLVLAPGAADTFPTSALQLSAPGDTLPNGRYYVTAALDRIRDLVNVAAGPVDIVSPNAGLTFAAATRVSGTNLEVKASLTNTNPAPVRLEYGACAVSLLAYRTADLAGMPVWNSDYRRPYGSPNTFYGCFGILLGGVIKPGETLSPATLNPSFPVLELLGDSLSGGRYYFKALVRMNWRTVALPAGEADVRR